MIILRKGYDVMRAVRAVTGKKKKRTLLGFVSGLAFFAFVVTCIASIISDQSGLADKREELAELQAEREEIEAKNGELSRLLVGDDLSEYMEMLATQQLNYSYPNERRFYDTTGN